MSGQVITELFEQIVHSEEKIKQRFEDLKKVNQEIQENQSKIKSIKYEREALQGKLINLRHKLLEEQLEEKWMTIRKDILTEQRQKCSQEKQKIQTQLEDLEDSQHKDSVSFLAECDRFLVEYNVLKDGSSQQTREAGMARKLRELKESKDVLLEDIKTLEVLDADKERLLKQQEEMKIEMEEMKQIKIATMESYESVTQELKHYKEMKEKNTSNPNTNPSMKSLHSELDRRKKELHFLTQEKKSLERQINQSKFTQNRGNRRENSRVETKRSNPWYFSNKNDEPGSSMTSSSSTRRFQYKPSERSNACNPERISRKRPAEATEIYENESNCDRRGATFDFDIDLSGDDDLMSSYIFQEIIAE